MAAINNHKESGEYLISKGANLNAQDISKQNTIILLLINKIHNKSRKFNSNNSAPISYAKYYPWIKPLS